MTTKSIHYPTLSTAERDNLLCEVLGVKQAIRDSDAGYEFAYPPLSTDLNLLLKACGEKVFISLSNRQDPTRWGAQVGFEIFVQSFSPQDALSIAILRWAGKEISL